MNKNHYVGLLAGVLTAGIVQGSDGKENIPVLGGQQIPVVQQQGMGNPILSEIILSESERPSTPAELTHITIGENRENREVVSSGKTAKKTKLDPYSMQIATKYFESAEDLHNATLVNSKFKDLDNRNRINYIPVTEKNKALFDCIETQQIFGIKDEIIFEGMYQYIITYPVTGAEIKGLVNQLQNIHDGEASGNGKKPIIFQAQKFDTLTIKPVPENQYFEIKSYWCNINTGNNRLSARKYYDALKSYNKPIIFGKTERDLKFSTGVKVTCFETEVSYQEYLELVNKYGDNFFVEFVNLNPNSMQELQQQLGILIKSKNVNQIRIDSEVYVDVSNIPLEYLGCVKIREMNFTNYQNPNGELFLIRTMIGSINNVQCKTIYCFDVPYPEQNTSVNRIYDRIAGGNVYELKNQRIPIDKVPKDVDESLREKEKDYVQYIKRHDLEYLSGYVNIENKPAELSDDEWRKVIILKGKAEEIKMLMRYDQRPKEKFFIVKNTMDEVIEAGRELSRINEANISYELNRNNLRIQDVTGDGNCGIYALLAGLNPNQAGNYQSVRQDSQEWRNAETLRQTLFGNADALSRMVDGHNQLDRWLALDNNEALQAVNTYVRNQGRSSLIILDTTVMAESGVAFTVIGVNGEQIRYNTLSDALNASGDNPLLLVYTPNHWKAVVPSNK